MNQKQQDSVAKLYYDLGKSLFLACIAAAFMPHAVSGKLILLTILGAAIAIQLAYDLDGREIDQ